VFIPDEKFTEEMINNFCLNREFLLKSINTFNKDFISEKRGGSALDEIDLRNALFISTEERDKNILDQRKTKVEMPKVMLFRSRGCEKCGKSGFVGRIGIYEVLEVTETIGKLIIAHASASEIKREAVKNGMVTMQQDGLLKALEGITTVEEVLRVTKE
jgi:hypothetical protein